MIYLNLNGREIQLFHSREVQCKRKRRIVVGDLEHNAVLRNILPSTQNLSIIFKFPEPSGILIQKMQENHVTSRKYVHKYGYYKSNTIHGIP